MTNLDLLKGLVDGVEQGKLEIRKINIRSDFDSIETGEEGRNFTTGTQLILIEIYNEENDLRTKIINEFFEEVAVNEV